MRLLAGMRAPGTGMRAPTMGMRANPAKTREADMQGVGQGASDGREEGGRERQGESRAGGERWRGEGEK
eukprot:747339-Hanusia_phi.AAC.1